MKPALALKFFFKAVLKFKQTTSWHIPGFIFVHKCMKGCCAFHQKQCPQTVCFFPFFVKSRASGRKFCQKCIFYFISRRNRMSNGQNYHCDTTIICLPRSHSSIKKRENNSIPNHFHSPVCQYPSVQFKNESINMSRSFTGWVQENNFWEHSRFRWQNKRKQKRQTLFQNLKYLIVQDSFTKANISQ